MTDYKFPAKVDKKTAAALIAEHDYEHDFWRAVPAAQWKAFETENMSWWARTIGFARGLKETGTLTIHEKIPPAELDVLWKIATSGKPGVIVHYNSHPPAIVSAWAERATTDELAVALDASCSTNCTQTFFAGLSPTQITAIKRARMISDAAATDADERSAATTRRGFFLLHDAVSQAEWDAIAEIKTDEMFGVPYQTPPELLAGLRKNLDGVRPSVRTWVENNLLGDKYLFDRDSRSTESSLLLWAASLESPDDPFVAKASAIIEAGDFGKRWVRERATPRIADALLAAPNPKATLVALRGKIKSKTLLSMFEAVEALLTTNLGLSGAAEVSWIAMDPSTGCSFIQESDDAKKTVAEGLANADGNCALRIFLATGLALRATKDLFDGAEWKTLKTILARLEKTAGPDLPSEIVRPTWGKMTADEAFAWAFDFAKDGLRWSSSKPMEEDDLLAEMQKLHDASKNERFRGLLKGVLGESVAAKLVRLAAACDHGKGSVTRWFAERTDDEPGKKDINRLYGSPIGVSAKNWPMTTPKKSKSKTAKPEKPAPMQHILTLETKALDEEAQAHFDGVAAIAVFLADINEPQGQHAIVELSRADLAKVHKPLVAPAIEGVKLALHEIEMPAAAYQGGAKKGPLKELRTALDHLDGVLSTDRGSAHWIQEPEPQGALIAQLDESFAPKLNFGDSGAIYVMTGGVVFQCH